jgi:GxxExxY protein
MIHHEGTKDTKLEDLGLSHRIVGAAIEVHRHLGPGLLESAYEAALGRELALRDLSFEHQVPVSIHYKGVDLDCALRIDVLVEDRVIVEVKTVDRLLPIHLAQLLTDLRLQNLWLGLLINFNVSVLRSGVRRVLNG